MSELDDLVRNRRFDEIHEARRQVIDDERSINEAMTSRGGGSTSAPLTPTCANSNTC